METTLSAETIKALAKEIAIAQLTAPDEFIEEQTASWSDEYKAAVNRPDMTQAARIEAFRANRANAERQIAQEAAEDAQRAERGRIAAQEHEQRIAQTIEQNRLQNVAALAQFEADTRAAELNNRTGPNKPLLLPESPEELGRQLEAARVKESF